jgi:hypothetical protein
MIHLNIKKNKMRKLSSFLYWFCFKFFCFGTKSTIYTHDLKDFNKALSLFKDGQFVSTEAAHEKIE